MMRLLYLGFLILISFHHQDIQCLSSKHLSLYAELIKQTKEHTHYLSQIGLEERAKCIKVNWFQFEDVNLDSLDITHFYQRTNIPQEVTDFDPCAKNTLITMDPEAKYNKAEDIRKILDIRLYPTLRNLIKQNGIEIFLGTTQEMVAYYQSKCSKILFEFSIPSSAVYYLAESNNGNLFVVMARLVSRENIIAQLLTLKLAGIDIENIEIHGEIVHFSQRVKKDIDTLLHQVSELKIGKHALIVAGCGLEDVVNEMIQCEFPGLLGEMRIFTGDIVSLVYTPFLNPIHDIHGFISLNLNYGEIMEEIVRLFLENCHCKYFFTGGAGGYIPKNSHEQKPDIGSRIGITKCMNEQGEILTCPEIGHDQITSMHLQIPSIFLETYDWLKRARERGTSVDVETFYMIRAVQNYNEKHPSDPIKADCGYFVSDYVGEKPLREYSKVYQRYPEVLSKFLQNITKN